MSGLKVFGWVCLGMVALGGVAIVGGFINTAATVATAPGRVVTKTLQTDNIIASYEFFHDANNQFIARVGQVKAFKKISADPTTDSMEKNRLRIELAAIQQSCRDLAGKYNSNSAKVNKSIFRGGSAPETLNIAECE